MISKKMDPDRVRSFKTGASTYTQTPAVVSNVTGQRTQADTTDQDDDGGNFFSKYKTPLLIGGGLLLAGIIFYMNRNKSK